MIQQELIRLELNQCLAGEHAALVLSVISRSIQSLRHPANAS